MAAKESTTTQPGDSLNDQFERRLAAGREALRRSKEASAAAQTAQTHHDKKWQERQLEELKEVKESRRQTRERMAEVHKVWMATFSPLEAKATEAPADNQPTEEALRETTTARLPKTVAEWKRCDKKKRRTLIDNFIAKVTDAGWKITRKDIWTVAGYQDKTEFARFQRGDTKTTKSGTDAFNRVLNMNPDDFMRLLKNKLAAK